MLKIVEASTVKINALVLQKKRSGEKVFNLSAGEPMLPPPPVVSRAVARALQNQQTHYPPAAGIPELRRAVLSWLNQISRSNYRVENLLVTSGGKFGLYLLLQALLNRGDEVLIPSPYWVSYPEIVKIFSGKPKIIKSRAENFWKVTASDIANAVSKKTKILLLNSASNPTGTLYSHEELKAILAQAKKSKLFVISDEVYSGLVYGGKAFVSCAAFAQYRKTLAIVQSCSKNFAITGLRVGFVAAEQEIIKVLTSLTSQSTSGVATLSQWAAVAAIQNSRKFTPGIRKSMRERRDVFVKAFNKAFKQNLTPPDSGLYAFVPLSQMGWQGKNSEEFCRRALAETNVAAVPGNAFGAEGYVRFSFGERPQVLKQGIAALAAWIKWIK